VAISQVDELVPSVSEEARSWFASATPRKRYAHRNHIPRALVSFAPN